MEFFYIFIAAYIQGGVYDFAGWYGIFKERSGHKWEWLYRLLKEILDFVVTPVIMIYCFKWNPDLIGAFYILKWFGWCDAFYIAMWKAFNPKRNYTQEGIWWMWWTPLGMIRSQFIYNPNIQDYGEFELIKLHGNTYFKKGIISFTEFLQQLLYGVVAAWLIYYFNAINVIYKLILLIF